VGSRVPGTSRPSRIASSTLAAIDPAVEPEKEDCVTTESLCTIPKCRTVTDRTRILCGATYGGVGGRGARSPMRETELVAALSAAASGADRRDGRAARAAAAIRRFGG
jgi:hypothetical protein